MQTKSRTKVASKDYSPIQILLLPPSLEEMIDPNHQIRVVNQVIDSLDIDILTKKYKGRGCSSEGNNPEVSTSNSPGSTPGNPHHTITTTLEGLPSN